MTQTFERHTNATLLLQLAGGQRIETTPEHPFYVEGRGFVRAAELGIGTSIVTRAGPNTQVLATQLEDTPATVYNLEVADFHTYFVGSAGAWVHNTCELPTNGTVVERNLQVYPRNADGSTNTGGEFTDLDRIERIANSDELLVVSERLNLSSGPKKAGTTASRARDTLDKYKDAITGDHKVHPDIANRAEKQALLDELRTKWAEGKVRIGLHLRHPDPSDELLRKTKEKVEEWEKTNGIAVGYKFEKGPLTDPVSPVE